MTQILDMSKIRLGFVGGGKGSWTDNAHIPGLKYLTDKFEIVAVSTTRIESSKAFAEEHNIPYYFDNADDLVNHKDVDLVVISVKVPYHYEIAKSAIKAGKNIYCEWPLANGYAESEEITNLAKEHNVKAFVGLQSRSLPEINFLKDYIKEGNIGTVLSTSVIGSGMVWGPQIDGRNLYLYDEKNGATMVTIPFGHTIDAVQYVLGGFKSLNAFMSTRVNKVLCVNDNKTYDVTSPDQLVVGGVLEDDVVISTHYRGGLNKGTNFIWEINGEKGDIIVHARNGHIQMGYIEIEVAVDGKEREKIEVPKEYFNGLLLESKGMENHPSYGMAHAYYNVYEDITNNKKTIPTFEDALKNHKLIDYIYSSHKNKKTVQVE